MRVAIVDCETTGLEASDVPISISVVITELDQDGRGVIVNEWHGEQEPNVPISDGAFSVHGITRESLSGKSYNFELLDQAMSGCTIAIAHNATFDAVMIAKVWPKIASLEWRCSFQQWPFPQSNGLSLDAACESVGVHRDIRHSARADAMDLLKALNCQSKDQSKTFLQLLLDRQPLKESLLTARRTTETDNTAETATQKSDIIVLAIAMHARKLILSPQQDSPAPIITIDWYNEVFLSSRQVGDTFPLSSLLNLIVATHEGKSILDIDGRENRWLLDLIEAGEEVGATIVHITRSFVDFAVWKRSIC